MTQTQDKCEPDERAVSPVIGVILMVAITVILAAVIGAFVLGLGDQVGNTAPSASFDYDWNSSNTNLTITHDGGDALDNSTITITINGDEAAEQFSVDTITAGDQVEVNETTGGDALGAGDTVRIIWESDSGQSSTVGTYEVPS